MRTSIRLPEEMSDKERIEEVADLLARAICRMQETTTKPPQTANIKRSSTGLSVCSKHSYSANKSSQPLRK